VSGEEEESAAIADLPVFARVRVQAFREFLKEEYKKHIREVYESDPEIQKMIQEALAERAEARQKLRAANLKLLRAAGRFGIELRGEEPRLDKHPVMKRLIRRFMEKSLE
jgi:predicted nucleotide-binding protein (sugar kinase/HSP70/actin superfamily)